MTIVIPHPPGKSAAHKKAAGRCVTLRCRRPAKRGRSLCACCIDRGWRARHPEHHLWNNLKKSAKRRGISFNLTLEEFKAWCAENNFVAQVGKGPDDATVDRRDPSLGYEKGNLRVLSNRENGTLGGHLANSGHRTPGQTELFSASQDSHYTAEEHPLQC